jgi:hypothetical protein
LIDEDTIIHTNNCVGDGVSEEFFRDHPLPPRDEDEQEELEADPQEQFVQFVEHVPEEIDATATCLSSLPRKRRPSTRLPFESEIDAYAESDEDYEEEEKGRNKNAKKRQRKLK